MRRFVLEWLAMHLMQMDNECIFGLFFLCSGVGSGSSQWYLSVDAKNKLRGYSHHQQDPLWSLFRYFPDI